MPILCPLLAQSGHERLGVAAVQLGLKTPFRSPQIPQILLYQSIRQSSVDKNVTPAFTCDTKNRHLVENRP